MRAPASLILPHGSPSLLHGDVDEVFDNPQHPYTQALLSAIPVPDPDIERTRQRVVFDPETMSTRPATV